MIKNPPANAGDGRGAVQSLGQEDPLEEGMAPVSLPGESYGQRDLADYSPKGGKELDMTEAT